MSPVAEKLSAVKYHEVIKMPKLNKWTALPGALEASGTQNFQLSESASGRYL
jgi:hypothetical protein